ncbi:hypothetical protein B9Z19DRAFT_1093480 [Tuber borchii]|uniref:Uncharacterized protein n=1 Tax=Tuber borchii TaxID=42251 RepID=A0A2T6ZFB8_TUBBO|nr:hypothetical protein B9Z19DRAFT_1093480 [Tuber borchii]
MLSPSLYSLDLNKIPPLPLALSSTSNQMSDHSSIESFTSILFSRSPALRLSGPPSLPARIFPFSAPLQHSLTLGQRQHTPVPLFYSCSRRIPSMSLISSPDSPPLLLNL